MAVTDKIAIRVEIDLINKLLMTIFFKCFESILSDEESDGFLTYSH